MGITIRELITKFTADNSSLAKGTAQGIKAVQQFGADTKKALSTIAKDFAYVGAAATGAAAAIVYLTDKVAAAGDKIAKDAKRIGMAASDLSALGYAAKLSGTEVENVVVAMRFLSIAIQDAKQKMDSPAGLAFKTLGIDPKQIKNLKDGLILISDKLRLLKDQSQKIDLAATIFGRGALALLPLLDEGGEKIREMTEEARRLGGVWTDEQARMAEETNDAFERIKTAFRGFVKDLVLRFMPDVKAGLDWLSNFWQANRESILAWANTGIDWARDKVAGLIDKLKELATSGRLDQWAADTARVLKTVGHLALVLAESVLTLLKSVKALNDYGKRGSAITDAIRARDTARLQERVFTALGEQYGQLGEIPKGTSAATLLHKYDLYKGISNLFPREMEKIIESTIADVKQQATYDISHRTGQSLSDLLAGRTGAATKEVQYQAGEKARLESLPSVWQSTLDEFAATVDRLGKAIDTYNTIGVPVTKTPIAIMVKATEPVIELANKRAAWDAAEQARLKAGEPALSEFERSRQAAATYKTSPFNIDTLTEETSNATKSLNEFLASTDRSSLILGDLSANAFHVADTFKNLSATIADIENMFREMIGAKRRYVPKGVKEYVDPVKRGKVPRKFAQGGVVPGLGGMDTVPAWLTPGEYVLPTNFGSMLAQQLRAFSPAKLAGALSNMIAPVGAMFAAAARAQPFGNWFTGGILPQTSYIPNPHSGLPGASNNWRGGDVTVNNSFPMLTPQLVRTILLPEMQRAIQNGTMPNPAAWGAR